MDAVILTFKNRQIQAVHWVPAKNIHLTLRFLGDTTLQQIEAIKPSLIDLTQHYQPFEVNIEGSGAFPNLKRPRVVWIGVKAPDSLFQLQKSIEAVCHKIGFETETRPFSPHLTLGRVSQNNGFQNTEPLSKALQEIKVNHLGKSPVNQITLFKSDLKPHWRYLPAFSKIPPQTI